MKTPKPGWAGRAGAWAREALTVLFVLYLVAVALDAALYRFGNSLPFLNAQARELLYSFDVFDVKSHPLYREWLKAFVFGPEDERETHYAKDTYKAYGLQAPQAPPLHLGPMDALGWPNATPIGEAKVLFIGDSFTYGAGSGTEGCIYSAYARLTGLPVYGAARGGYGLPHYPLILSRLTSPAQPPDERFTGKRAVVVYYNGNDALADTLIYAKRLAMEHETWTRHLRLTGGARLYDFVCENLNPSRKTAASSRGTAAQTGNPDHGGFSSWRDVHLLVPTQAAPGEPFALHPFYAGRPEVATMLDVFGPGIRANLDALAQSGRQGGVEVQVVLMPTALQVLAPFVDPASIEPGSVFAREMGEALNAFNLLEDFVEHECEARGLATLDLREPLRRAADPGLLYWPWDTHLTPYGNEVAARAIAAHFSQP